jgi:hypothetical protein
MTESLVRTAGLLQLTLAAGSLAIPGLLGWKDETARMRPLARQVFWAYAAYILGAHLAFGLVSALAAAELLDGSPLAAVVTGFIALWWSARLVLQFVYFDRGAFPAGAWYRLGETALVALFVFLSVVYGAAFVVNLRP